MTAAVREGDIIAQRYRIKRVLGVGGMGVVMEATHIELNERVAIKLLLPELTNNAEASERFKREARAVAKLKSEHVARVFDVGKLDDDTPFMVMEYLEGETLAAKLDQEVRLPVGDAVDYILQACRALSAAHDKGIVHRDLKPSNLFLATQDDNSRVLKVLDFGISKLNSIGGMNEGSITKTSAVMGSPNYMSPEQMRSTRTVDARSDIWSLGVTLYELIAGVPPFVGQTFPEVCLAIAQDEPAPLSRHVPDLPPGLEAVIHRCLEKSPERRFAKVSELARALVPFAPNGGRTAMRWSITNEASHSGSLPRIETAATAPSLLPIEPPVTGTGPVPPVAANTGGAWGNTHQWQESPPAPPPPRRLAKLAVVATTVAGAALGTWFAWHLAHRGAAPPLPSVSASAARAPDASAEVPPPSAPAPSTASAPPLAPSPPTIVPTTSSEPATHAPPAASPKPPPPAVIVRPPPPVRPARPPTSGSGKPGPGATPPPDPPSSSDPFGGRK